MVYACQDLFVVLLFFFYCSVAHRDLHSFPTRRSSDLAARGGARRRAAAAAAERRQQPAGRLWRDRKSTRLNSSHQIISYAVFCLKKKQKFLTLMRPSIVLILLLGLKLEKDIWTERRRL